MRKAIFIVGMHRSGTSALTGSLVQLGYPMPRNPMPDTPNNPKGHFESTAIWKANERVFSLLKRTWKHCGAVDLGDLPDQSAVVSELCATMRDEFGDAPKIAVKDPRISLLLPLWLDVCEELQLAPTFVLMHRHPEEVASSLNRRDGMDMLQGYYLWARYTLDAERHTRGMLRVGIDSADLLADPLGTLGKLATVTDDEEMRAAIESGQLEGFVDPRLMTQLSHEDRPVRRFFDDVYSDISQVGLPDRPDPQEILEQLDLAAAELAVPTQAIDGLQDRVVHLDARHKAEERNVASLKEELATARKQQAETQGELTAAHGEIRKVSKQLEGLGKELTAEQARHLGTRRKLDQTQLQLSRFQYEELRLRGALVDARTKPIRNLRNNISFNVLTSITGPNSKLPERMRERFKRSARKRAPLRDAEPLAFDMSPPAQPAKAPVPPRNPRFDPAQSEAWKAALLSSDAVQKLEKNKPLVSIILPTKDREQLLQHAINSALAQSYDNWELIIIDDGSTDNTVQMVKNKFPDPRIQILPAEGSGVCAARNTGLSHSQGSFIAYLDSDNRWIPDFLELTLLEMIRSDARTCYSVLRGFRNGFDSEEGIYYYNRPFDLPSLKIENYIDLNIFVHRRELFEELGGFDTNLRRMVDWDLIIRYCEASRPAFCNSVGVDYDNSQQPDRITRKERRSYLDVVRNKHLVDWESIRSGISERDPDLVSVIICVFNNPVLTDKCLNSLFAHEAGAPFEVVIVDNGSDAETIALLEQWSTREERIRLIFNPVNMNFSLGNNIGFEASRGSRVVFLNNDTEVTPEWLRSLIAPLEEDEILGVQPKLVYPDGTLQAAGLVFTEYGPFAYPLYVGLPGDHPLTVTRRRFRAITAACLAMRAGDFAKAGGFDPIYTNGQEDVDLCLRVGGLNPSFTCATDSVVVHHEGKTAGRGKNIASNREIFAERWSGKIVADDKQHYSEDGVIPRDYTFDSQEHFDRGIAIYRPTLEFPSEFAPIGSAMPLLAHEGNPVSIRFRIPCPRQELKDRWGDYHFAVALVKALAVQGCKARIDFLDNWNEPAGADEVDFVLRGLSPFEINSAQTSRPAGRAMWIISHPDKISDDELNGYDIVFVASEVWARTLSERGLKPRIVPLLQCTEAERFFPEAKNTDFHHDRLYVGNSRKVLRTVVAKAIAEDTPIDIFGEMWEGLAPNEWIKDEHIPNVNLASYYASADVVLNDHWDAMRNSGFASNRIFDVLATATPLVTDFVVGLPGPIAEACAYLEEDVPLLETIETAITMKSTAERKAISDFVRREHSFTARARSVLQHLSEIVGV